MAELVKWMKEPGRTAKVAHAGVGSFGHLCRRAVRAGASALTVIRCPIAARGPALNDLLAGHVDLSSLSAVRRAPLVKAGKLKAYAIIGKTRFAGLPDLPTMGELGYKKLDLDFWHILFAPAGTPRPIIDRLNAALRHALADAKVKEDFTEGGMDLYPADQETPEAASRHAQERDQALGRRDPRQQDHGAVSARRPSGRNGDGSRPG